MINRALLTRPALIAAAAGAAIGAGLGLWSVRHTVSTRSAAPATAVVEPIAVATNGTAAARSPVVSQHEAASKSSKAQTPQAIATDVETLRQRASALAQKGDVAALLAMRDAVLRRAEQQGEQASDATRHDLDDIDRYLVDARGMRLKLDGEALRRTPK